MVLAILRHIQYRVLVFFLTRGYSSLLPMGDKLIRGWNLHGAIVADQATRHTLVADCMVNHRRVGPSRALSLLD